MVPPKPVLRKKFYQNSDVLWLESGFAVTLDGKRIKAANGEDLTLPTKALAEAVAREWQAQKHYIEPLTMPLLRLANSCVVGVAHAMSETLNETLRYGESDLVYHRAVGPAELIALEDAAWNPVLNWAENAFDVRLTLVQGVVCAQQSHQALLAISAFVRNFIGNDGSTAFRLGGLSAMVALTGSLLIVMAYLGGAIDGEAAWRAAQLEEEFNHRRWGVDAEAQARAILRHQDFLAAHQFVELVRGS